jgi:hypothetical protein
MDAMWSGIWDAANGAVVAVFPGLIYVALWLAGIATLTWIVLAAVTASLSIGARRDRATVGDGSASDIPVHSHSARPALFWAIAIAVTVGLFLPVAASMPQWAARWWFTVSLAALAAMDVGLLVCFARVIRDIRSNDRVAGPYTLAAYLTVTVGSTFALWTGYFLGWIIGAANYKAPF